MMLWKAKCKAFLSHALFSTTIVLVFFLVIHSFWYPGALFDLENVWEALEVLVPVDAVLGPVLTLYLWDPNKQGVKFDIAVVLILQVAALAYGGVTIYQQRPAALVFAADRFEVIPASQFDRTQLNNQYFDRQTIDEPLVAYALPAQNREENNAFVLNNVQYQKMPERYRPMREYAKQWQKRALRWDAIKPEGDALARWDAFKQHYHSGDTFLFPLEGTTGESIMVAVNAQGDVLHYLALDPWAVYKESVRPSS
ncbi:MAG TPA: hypothetical protein VIM96_08860 [Pseudomonadales bacterium]